MWKQVALLQFTASVAEQSLMEKSNVWGFIKKHFFLASLFKYEEEEDFFFFFKYLNFHRKNNVLLIVS